MNTLYWFLGRSSVPHVACPDLTIESFVLVETEESRRAEIERLRDKLPQFPVHPIDISASVCCVSDAAEQLRALTLKVPSPLPQPTQYEEDGPYALAFWSQVKKSDVQFSKSLYFINSSILAARGCMAKMENVRLFSENEIPCNTQVFLDFPRWGKNAHLIVDGALHALRDLKESCFEVNINQTREASFKLVSLLDSIHQKLGNVEIFSLFTRYFHQGPFNDMVYSIMADCMNHWEASMIPDQNEMTRTFNLVRDTKTKVHRLIISVRGYFNAGYVPDIGTLEPVPGRKLGMFHGVTIINLHTGAAFVRTFVERYNQNWKIV